MRRPGRRVVKPLASSPHSQAQRPTPSCSCIVYTANVCLSGYLFPPHREANPPCTFARVQRAPQVSCQNRPVSKNQRGTPALALESSQAHMCAQQSVANKPLRPTYPACLQMHTGPLDTPSLSTTQKHARPQTFRTSGIAPMSTNYRLHHVPNPKIGLDPFTMGFGPRLSSPGVMSTPQISTRRRM